MPEMRYTRFTTPGAQRVTAMWRAAAAQPGWVSRAVLLTFILIIAVPIMLLVLLALLAATVVWVVLYGVNRLMMAVRGTLPKRDGRENVRVIRRRDDA